MQYIIMTVTKGFVSLETQAFLNDFKSRRDIGHRCSFQSNLSKIPCVFDQELGD